MEKARKEALQWFVDFANSDLGRLGMGDRAKLIIESYDFLLPAKEERRQFPRFLVPGERVKFKSIKGMKEMDWIGKARQESYDPSKYWGKIKRLHRVVRETFGDLSPGSPSKGYRSWIGKMKVTADWQKNRFSLQILPVGADQTEHLRLRLFLLLDGLPTSAVQKCPGCDKYFLNVSLRKKQFCSPRCMWRVNTQKRREADKEGYNEYQRVHMNNRYRKKKGLKQTKKKDGPRETDKGV
jgi:hypothetical protein